MSVLRAGAHEYQIRSAPVLVLSRLQGFSSHAEKKTNVKKHLLIADAFFSRLLSQGSHSRLHLSPFLFQKRIR
ncbi:hypothetical protein CEY07_12405 [Bacillus safensis]|nr:hypothetical protein CEY07_12405 [Bacillus safensis]